MFDAVRRIILTNEYALGYSTFKHSLFSIESDIFLKSTQCNQSSIVCGVLLPFQKESHHLNHACSPDFFNTFSTMQSINIKCFTRDGCIRASLIAEKPLYSLELSPMNKFGSDGTHY